MKTKISELPVTHKDPARLCEVKLPFTPLLGDYFRRTSQLRDDGGPAWRRLSERLQENSVTVPLARTRAAVLSGLAAAVLGVWLFGRAPGVTGGGGGSEGTSGTSAGSGGVSGTDPRAGT
jgi:hypothetical protein